MCCQQGFIYTELKRFFIVDAILHKQHVISGRSATFAFAFAQCRRNFTCACVVPCDLIVTDSGVEEIDIDPKDVARHEAYAAAKKQKRPQNGRKKKLSAESSFDDKRKAAVFVKASDSEAESTSSVTSSTTGGENFEQSTKCLFTFTDADSDSDPHSNPIPVLGI